MILHTELRRSVSLLVLLPTAALAVTGNAHGAPLALGSSSEGQ
jgi:hypothetical protein